MSATLLERCCERGVLRLTLNRPDVHNAFDDTLISALHAAFERAAADDTVRVLVLAGAGKSFSAGADMHYMRRMGTHSFEDNLADANRLAAMLRCLDTLPKPTVCRLHGAAMGGGVGLVSCCDIVIGSPRAKLALSEVKIGMIPATISPYVVRAIGARACRRLFQTGEMVHAERALALGWLSEVVEEDALDGAVDAVVEVLLANAPSAVRLAKQLVFDVADGAVDDRMVAQTVESIARVRDSVEGREGLSAFLEKRPPAWQGP
ncbi:MAG: enoyl-CoA hydratase/isomerase family protein [Pseudomonadota bacterium]